MTLAEAAAGPAAPPPAAPSGADSPWTAAEMAHFIHLMDWQIHAAKRRRDAALREARRRGLDAEAEEEPPPSPRFNPAPRRSRAWRTLGRNPDDYARVLLTETSLRLHEIVELTGLDIYRVVGFKLKLERGL